MCAHGHSSSETVAFRLWNSQNGKECIKIVRERKNKLKNHTQTKEYLTAHDQIRWENYFGFSRWLEVCFFDSSWKVSVPSSQSQPLMSWSLDSDQKTTNKLNKQKPNQMNFAVPTLCILTPSERAGEHTRSALSCGVLFSLPIVLLLWINKRKWRKREKMKRSFNVYTLN